jgi:methylated-DNA-[protein]-cysteine S-methyltransferase
VGTAMARNRAPLIVPCHRVVAADGSLGGFSAPGGTATKRRLLEIEGAHTHEPDTLFAA